MNGSTSTDNLCFERTSLTIKLSLTLAYAVLILASLLGNSLLLAVVRRDRTTKRTIIYFIQNMAMADLLITIVYMPRMVTVVLRGYQWLLDGAIGLALCVLVPLCHHAAILVSIQTLVIISVERFLAIVYPLKRNVTTKQARYLVALTWFVSIAVRIPRSVALRLKHRETSGGRTFCATMFSSVYDNAVVVRRIYYETLLYLFYVVPVISIVAVNLVIIFTLRRRKLPGHWTSKEQKRKEQINRKIFRMLLTITCLFIVCWLLYFIVLLIPNPKFKCEIGFARFFCRSYKFRHYPVCVLLLQILLS